MLNELEKCSIFSPFTTASFTVMEKEQNSPTEREREKHEPLLHKPRPVNDVSNACHPIYNDLIFHLENPIKTHVFFVSALR